MKETLEYILKNILGEDVATVAQRDEDGILTFTITAPQEEIGKIIGKGGRTINSIKNILKIRAIKEEKKIEIEVKEN